MLIIDRIEGEFAVCEAEGRVFRTLPLADLPQGVKEGDCLRESGGCYAVDTEETARRRAENVRRMRAMFKDEK